MADYIGRRILYTGAAGGLGLPGVLAFLDRGATVVVLDRDSEKIKILEELSKGTSGRLIIKQVELANEVEVRSSIQDAMDEIGGIDTLINNAAVYPIKTV